jgi:class 3 adenylate cyclase
VGFIETIEQARALLERNGRLSLRALRRQFELDDDALEELVEELVDVQQVAALEGKILSWIAPVPIETRPADAEAGTAAGEGRAPASERDPRDYTPKHLADKILQSKSALEGERKQVTVLFADVKGSMELAESVDAEQLHRIMDRFFEILADGVHRFEGTVNQYTGDGIMALFGAPIAHEDHAQRACLAALALRDALRQFGNELRLEHGLSFAMRMGIHSGEVIVGKIGDDLRMDYTAQGQTVNLAARMEQIAEPGEVYLTERTARLVQGYMELEDLGVAKVKGATDPVGIFALRGLGKVRTRLDVSRARGLTRFVGRGAELGAIETAFGRASQGNGHVVGVVAEAGTGKSRLCFEFLEQARSRGVATLEGYGVPHGASVPMLPMLQLQRAAFGIEDGDSDQQAREKIAGRLLLRDESMADTLPILFELMRVPDPERPVPDIPTEQRDRIVADLVRRLVHTRSDREPAILLLEDLHWFDESSDRLLEHLVQAVPGTRTLLLVNFRPGYSADWMQQSYYQQIALQPLVPADLRAWLMSLLGNDESLGYLADRIQDRSGGNPFFTEELVQALVETGALEGAPGGYRLTAPASRLEMPPTVQAVLSARMDRLAEREKHVLQSASVIGRSFSESLLREIAELPKWDLAEALHQLTTGEFLHETAVYPESEYQFKHALTQEVAYGSQLQDTRQRLHRAIAAAIEERERERLDEHAALLAHHLGLAGEPLEASRWHARAARVGDHSETVLHWEAICDRLGGDPASGEATELVLRAKSGLILRGVREGRERAQLERLMVEARELATRSGDAENLARALVPAAYQGILRGRIHVQQALIDQVYGLRDAVSDRGLLAALIYMKALHAFMSAVASREAAELLEEALAIIGGDDDLGREYVGTRPAINCRALRGSALVETGHMREGEALIRESRRMALESSDVYELFGPTMTTLANCDFEGSWEGTVETARELVEIAATSAPAMAPVARACLGAAMLHCGEPEAGLQFLGAWLSSTGDDPQMGMSPLLCCWAARAYGICGDPGQALETLERGLEALAYPREELSLLLERARWLVASQRTLSDESLRSTVDRARALIERMGSVVHAPKLVEIESRAARLAGEEALHRERLAEARRLYQEVGARGHLERLAQEFDA